MNAVKYAAAAEAKPTKYYVDFENVHGPGLKGIDSLSENDEVLVFYSQAAETFHIEQTIDILNSKATVKFVEIDGGTRNSLDFQLVAALFGMMDDQHDYAIVSADGGFDAAIKMGERLELPAVRRITDLTGSTEAPAAKSTRSRRSRAKKAEAADKPEQQAEQANDEGAGEEAAAKQKKRQPKPAGKKEEAKSSAKAGDGAKAGVGAKAGEKANPKPEAKPAAKPAPIAEPLPEADAPSPEEQPTAAPARSGRYSKRKEVKAMLAANGVALNPQQLSTVMKALNETKNKQGFYRMVIQLEKQERGLELYHKVRQHYTTMIEILRG